MNTCWDNQKSGLQTSPCTGYRKTGKEQELGLRPHKTLACCDCRPAAIERLFICPDCCWFYLNTLQPSDAPAMQLAQRRLFTQTDETEGELNLQSSECRTEVQRERNGLLAYDICRRSTRHGSRAFYSSREWGRLYSLQGVPKIGPTDSSPYFCQILTDLNNFFTGRLFGINLQSNGLLKIPQHLAYVATLPGET